MEPNPLPGQRRSRGLPRHLPTGEGGFHRRDDEIATQLEIAVSTEDDAEVRRLAVTNRGDRAREIEVTSYVEIVLAPPADDLAHPAFSKLFVESEYVPDASALLFRRRPRAEDEAASWAVHVLGREGRSQGPVEWESDRARFLGRGRDTSDPQALDGRPLSGTTGAVLDAVASLRQRLRLLPGATLRVAFATGVATSHDAALALAHEYHDIGAVGRTFALAFAHGQSDRRFLGIGQDEAVLFERLASRVLWAGRSLRAAGELLARNTLGQPTLWPHSISGDLPILLLRVVEEDDLSLVRHRGAPLALDQSTVTSTPRSQFSKCGCRSRFCASGQVWRARSRSARGGLHGVPHLLAGGRLDDD